MLKLEPQHRNYLRRMGLLDSSIDKIIYIELYLKII